MTRRITTRFWPLLVLSLLAACVTLAPEPNQPGQAEAVRSSREVPPAGVGRVGPDGAPPADTLPVGGPRAAAPQVFAPLVAERGIGGTGTPAAPPLDEKIADRGIGGTGIVGVVTGFGSIFVNGIEIEYDDSAPVDIDGVASPVSALRAGQMVAVRTTGPAAHPRAAAISVQSAVTGRIEALEPGSGILTIAGQAVSVPEGTWGANRFGLGDWVKVSGLRRADGTIVASRLDSTPAGILIARGKAVRDGSVTKVGNLLLAAPLAAGVKDGQYVVVSGGYAGGHGRVAAVSADPVFPDPAAFFGPSTNKLVVQAFVEVGKGSFSMNGVQVHAALMVASQVRHNGIAIVSLERDAAGSFVAVGLRYADYRGHTDRPFRGGSGAGTGDSSQVSRSSHTQAVASAHAYGSDSGSAANGQVATASMAIDPAPVSSSPGSTPPSQGRAPSQVASVGTAATTAGDGGSSSSAPSGAVSSAGGNSPAVAPAGGTGPAAGTSAGGISPIGDTASLASTSGTGSPGSASPTGEAGSTTPAGGTNPTGGGTGSGGGTGPTGGAGAGSGTGPTGGTGSITGTGSPGGVGSGPGISATAAGTSPAAGTSSTAGTGTATGTGPTAATGGTGSTGGGGSAGGPGSASGPGTAIIQSAPNPPSTSKLISSTSGFGSTPSIGWQGPRALSLVVHHRASQAARGSAGGSASAPATEMLTGAVTSSPAASPGTTAVQAGGTSQAVTAASSVTGKSTTTIGTTSGKHSSAGTGGSGTH